MWIGKFDGSLQCGLGDAFPLPIVEAELKHIVGEFKKSEWRRWPGLIQQACGLPTGACYAFEIGDDAAAEHREQLKAHGYFPWPDNEKEDRKISAAPARDSDWAARPHSTFAARGDLLARLRRAGGDDGFFPWMFTGRPPSLDTLLGKHCRLYKTGDQLSEEVRPDRANIELGPDGRIVTVWFG